MKKFLRYFLIITTTLVLLVLVWLYVVTKMPEPSVADRSVLKLQRVQSGQHYYSIGDNWIRRNKYGIWEMYLHGKPFERGVIHGKLAKELVVEQEMAMDQMLNTLIPNSVYKNFLRILVGIFNRNLEHYVPEEYREEIYGVSFSASEKFKNIAPAYQRLMNYHAAHDIGHAVQNMNLVGCSAFAGWDNASADGKLIIGRNFDFYAGDRFAKEKILMFSRPDKGYPYASVTWGGFIGVVSGMNTQGLTVTLNAAKSEIPTSSATPVSILAREILQYAKNIDEAIAIARTRRSFVAESFLIGSAIDNRAIVIEKTPDSLGIYSSDGNTLVCTNHYQSPELVNTPVNIEQLQTSASPYRELRIKELLYDHPVLDANIAAQILRDKKGLHGKPIGYGNEKCVNQLISHHSVIFEPSEKRMWLSTNPWQLGEYICYDLDSVFAYGNADDHEIINDSLTIPADTFMTTKAYHDFLQYRLLTSELKHGMKVDVNHMAALNPEYFEGWKLAGDYYFRKNNFDLANQCYIKALNREISSTYERNYIIAQMKKCDSKKKESL